MSTSAIRSDQATCSYAKAERLDELPRGGQISNSVDSRRRSTAYDRLILLVPKILTTSIPEILATPA